MANAFKNVRHAVTTAMTTFYTVPTGRTAVVILCQATNIVDADGWVTVTWLDASASSAETRLVHQLVLPVGSAVGVISGKLVLEAGDSLRAQADANSKVAISASVLEIY